MSIEGGNEKKYSPEEIAEFEKTRIRDSEKAHEEANMISSYFEEGEMPTKEDYDQALDCLKELQEEASHESLLINNINKPI